jgi:hypothetical protein
MADRHLNGPIAQTEANLTILQPLVMVFMDSEFMYDEYQVHRFIPPDSLPVLPSTPFPFAKYTYRRGARLTLEPMANHPLGEGTATRNGMILDHIDVGFGRIRQRVRLGTSEFGNVEARIFDSLYVDLMDLPNIRMVESHP